ncbi:fimbrial protein [Serratia marcescens]|uniref:fimbrial protein n=1 Tax=Serratia marcescens TaxID=615 RepID=UPI003F7F382F
MRKNYAPCVFLSAFLFLLVSEAQAFTCKTADGGIIPPGGSNTPVQVRVHIGPEFVSGKNLISNVSQVTCKNDVSSWTDYLTLASVIVNLSDLYLFNVGVTINGVDYDIPENDPFIKKRLLSVTGLQTVSVPMQMYIRVRKQPSRDISIRKGTTLAIFSMVQENDRQGCPSCGPYIWELIADNDAYFATTNCTINGGRQMNVDFGPISQDNFTTTVDSALIKQEQNLDYYCEGSNASQDIAVRLVGNASGFSSEAIKTSNENIGIAMVYKGKVVKPNEMFNSKIVNGIGSDTLNFVPIKKNIPFNEIRTGAFSGSATLVFSVP